MIRRSSSLLGLVSRALLNVLVLARYRSENEVTYPIRSERDLNVC